MKRIDVTRILSLLLACLLTAAFLTGCGKKLTETSEGVRVKDSTLFHHASTVYKPAEQGRRYGRLTVSEGMTLEVFAIEGLSTDKWLTTEDGDVLYADGVKLPTLLDLAPNAMQVFYQTSDHILRRVTSPAIVGGFAEAYENGTPVNYPNKPALRTLRVCFESGTMPALRYELTYLEYAEDIVIGEENCGRYFLYSRFDSRCVPVDGSLHEVLGLSDAGTGTAEAK